MQRILLTLLIGLPSAAAGFYGASFAYRLLVGILSYLVTMTFIILYLLGIVSSNTPSAPFAPLLLLQWAGASEIAFQAAGFTGTVGTLVLMARASSWRRAALAGAAILGFAAVAGAADLWYGVTPYVDRVMPHSDLAAVQRTVTCRLTVVEIARLEDKLSGCIAEVEGVLRYQNNMKRFALFPLEDRQPTIYVYFFRGRRPLFTEESQTGRPRYYDQVSNFDGRRVRIIGTAVNGALTADVGHVVAADARIQ
jgi:hypothetical protein